MQKNLVKKFGIVLVVCVLVGVLTSCKASHELCPAYSKVDTLEVNNY